jgi:hypothetical protein
MNKCIMDNKSPLTQVGSVDGSHSERASAHPAATSEPIQAWPKETHNLEERQREWSVIAYDTLLIVLPLGLLAKAIVVSLFGENNLNGALDLVPRITVDLVEFNSQLVTLYTIVFGTIIATLVRRYALWKAQKGASVAELEQIHSSISLPNTLQLIWSLRSWRITSVVLTLIWAWYSYGPLS